MHPSPTKKYFLAIHVIMLTTLSVTYLFPMPYGKLHESREPWVLVTTTNDLRKSNIPANLRLKVQKLEEIVKDEKICKSYF